VARSTGHRQLRRAILVRDLAGDGIGITLGYDAGPDARG